MLTVSSITTLTQRTLISTLVFVIAGLFLLPLSGPVHSAVPKHRPDLSGTSWQSSGLLRLNGKHTKTRTALSLPIFLGPQTVKTDSGHITLADDQFLLVLPRPGKDALLPGTYTPSWGGFKRFTPERASADDFAVALMEQALGQQYTGTVKLKQLGLLILPWMKKGQPSIGTVLKMNLRLKGAFEDRPVSGKWQIRFTAFDTLSGTVADTSGSECLIGGSSTASGCVVTTQQPVLQIPGTGTGNVYIASGTSANQNNAWVSTQINLSPDANCGGNTCFTVPTDAGLLPRQSYQWAFIPAGGSTNPSWQGFTIDYVRAGKEPTDSFGPLTIGLASGTVQTTVQSQAVQTASGTVQIGLSHRGFYTGTPTGKPWFIEDPAGALPVGWVFTGVDANVPWVRITAVDGTDGSTASTVTLQAFDGSLLEFTNTNGGSGGWAPPVGVGRPANSYGSLSQSSDGRTFTWTQGTSVVTFEQSNSDDTVWLANQAQVVLPGSGAISPGLQATWDNQGKLATLADQNSVDASGHPTRQAFFYYGGNTACGSPSGTGLVTAPDGMLCAFENLDGTRTQVYYTRINGLSPEFGQYQIGQVVLPGGATWNFDWQTRTTTLKDNTQITAPQLLSIQTPSGFDAANATTPVVAADDSKWWVVYDPFFGAFQGFVSPLPGVGPAADERIGRYYTIGSAGVAGQAEIAWGIITGSAGNFSLSPGASLQSVSYDSAWRQTGVQIFLDANNSYTMQSGWNASLDVQTGISYAGATQTQSYDFLGRPQTLTGPGVMSSTTTYDRGNLAGWIATVYDNTDFAAPGVTAEAVNSAVVNWSSAPTGVSSGDWAMQLAAYLPAPATGDSTHYRVSADVNGSATLWVNGRCSTTPDNSACNSGNTVSTSIATAQGDALNLTVQYIRNGTTVSGSNPVTIQVEQQIDGGDWSVLNLTDLDPGLNLKSSTSVSDTLSKGGAATTLTQSTAWSNALFQTQAGVTLPGFDGNRVTTPTYESDYDPANSQWKRLITQASPGQSRYGTGYWNNTETAAASACPHAQGVNQAGRIQTLTYPAPNSGSATGLSRWLSYDSAGRKVGLEVLPEGAAAGVSGCLSYDARGRLLTGQVEAYNGAVTQGQAMGKTWTYSPDGLSATITHRFDNPPQAPTCAGENSPPYTCTETQTVDLLGRTVATTDVWGTRVETGYQAAPGTGIQTTTVTTTAGAFTTTSTLITNRNGSPTSLSRSDSNGSPEITASWHYDAFGRLHSLATQSGGSEVITAAYSYDSLNRADTLSWSRSGNPVVNNTLALSPNSSRTLGEDLTLGGISYSYAHTFNTAGWLQHTTLGASDNSLNASWALDFATASLGSNSDAHLNGNVTTHTATLDGTSHSLELGYDYQDRVEATAPAAGINHDALGNLTQYGDLQLSYDQTNQLIRASDASHTISFDRTPDGGLYRKTTTENGSNSTIRYSTGGLVLDDSGNPSHQTLTIGNLVATLDLTDPGDTDYTVTTLQYGNALLMLDSSGETQNLAAPILYSPWGQAINAPDTDPARPWHGWQASNLLETTLDLVLMGERVYHTGLGRFTSVDPIFSGGANTYLYAANDPVNNNDPNGRQSQSVKDIFENAKRYAIKNQESIIKYVSYGGIGIGGLLGLTNTAGGIIYLSYKAYNSSGPTPDTNPGNDLSNSNEDLFQPRISNADTLSNKTSVSNSFLMDEDSLLESVNESSSSPVPKNSFLESEEADDEAFIDDFDSF